MATGINIHTQTHTLLGAQSDVGRPASVSGLYSSGRSRFRSPARETGGRQGRCPGWSDQLKARSPYPGSDTLGVVCTGGQTSHRGDAGARQREIIGGKRAFPRLALGYRAQRFPDSRVHVSRAVALDGKAPRGRASTMQAPCQGPTRGRDISCRVEDARDRQLRPAEGADAGHQDETALWARELAVSESKSCKEAVAQGEPLPVLPRTFCAADANSSNPRAPRGSRDPRVAAVCPVDPSPNRPLHARQRAAELQHCRGPTVRRQPGAGRQLDDQLRARVPRQPAMSLRELAIVRRCTCDG